MKYLIVITLLLLTSCDFQQDDLQKVVSTFVTVADEQGYEHKESISESDFACLHRLLLNN